MYGHEEQHGFVSDTHAQSYNPQSSPIKHGAIVSHSFLLRITLQEEGLARVSVCVVAVMTPEQYKIERSFLNEKTSSFTCITI